MKQTDPALKVRLPAEIKSWIRSEAIRFRRSQSAQVVVCVEEAMRRSTPIVRAEAAGSP